MKYEKPNLELIVLDSEDVITTSGTISNGGKGEGGSDWSPLQ